MEVALYLQEGAGELWSLATAEAWQSPLLTILPTGKLILAVANLRELYCAVMYLYMYALMSAFVNQKIKSPQAGL